MADYIVGMWTGVMALATIWGVCNWWKDHKECQKLREQAKETELVERLKREIVCDCRTRRYGA